MGPRAVRAQVAATTWSPGPAVAAAVRSAVAERWSLDPARVRLDFGHIRPPGDTATSGLVDFRTDSAMAAGLRLEAISPDGRVLLDLAGRAGAPETRLVVRAGVEVERVVAARALRRGDLLTAEDMTLDTTIAWGDPRAAAPDARPAAGWRINRYVAAGQPLREPGVLPPAAVRAGERVRAVYMTGGLSLTFAATAAADAAAGEAVPVRTDDGRRLVGVAGADGLVRLGPGASTSPAGGQ